MALACRSLASLGLPALCITELDLLLHLAPSLTRLDVSDSAR